MVIHATVPSLGGGKLYDICCVRTQSAQKCTMHFKMYAQSANVTTSSNRRIENASKMPYFVAERCMKKTRRWSYTSMEFPRPSKPSSHVIESACPTVNVIPMISFAFPVQNTKQFVLEHYKRTPVLTPTAATWTQPLHVQVNLLRYHARIHERSHDVSISSWKAK